MEGVYCLKQAQAIDTLLSYNLLQVVVIVGQLGGGFMVLWCVMGY